MPIVSRLVRPSRPFFDGNWPIGGAADHRSMFTLYLGMHSTAGLVVWKLCSVSARLLLYSPGCSVYIPVQIIYLVNYYRIIKSCPTINRVSMWKCRLCVRCMQWTSFVCEVHAMNVVRVWGACNATNIRLPNIGYIKITMKTTASFAFLFFVTQFAAQQTLEYVYNLKQTDQNGVMYVIPMLCLSITHDLVPGYLWWKSGRSESQIKLPSDFIVVSLLF
jgi:hypothetical protein